MHKSESADIENFISSGKTSRFASSKWLIYNTISFYAKVQFELMDGNFEQCLVLDSISADQPGEGRFSDVMDLIEKIANKYELTVIINSVINRRLYQWFLRRGYVDNPRTNLIVYKRTAKTTFLKNDKNDD
jgi:hypothetical protein